MQSVMPAAAESKRYAKAVEVSKRIRWDIERDVIKGRTFDFTKKFLPDGLSKVDRLDFLSPNEQRLLSQIQGRTYANVFGLVECFINANVLEHLMPETAAYDTIDGVFIGAKLDQSNNDSQSRVLCPITGHPCEGDLSYLCEDYGCARKGGLSPHSHENL